MIPSKPILYGIAALVLAALISLGIGMSLVAYRGALSDAAASARKERDAHWTAELEKSNRIVAEARAEAERVAAAADRAARDAADREKQLLSDLEKANAALPDAGSVGLSRERVCLIDPAGCSHSDR